MLSYISRNKSVIRIINIYLLKNLVNIVAIIEIHHHHVQIFHYTFTDNVFLTEMASSSSSSHPMCRSFSSESQRKEWSKRLSLRGIHKNRDVRCFVNDKFSFTQSSYFYCYRILLLENLAWHDVQHHYAKHELLKYLSMFPYHHRTFHHHQRTQQQRNQIGK